MYLDGVRAKCAKHFEFHQDFTLVVYVGWSVRGSFSFIFAKDLDALSAFGEKNTQKTPSRRHVHRIFNSILAALDLQITNQTNVKSLDLHRVSSWLIFVITGLVTTKPTSHESPPSTKPPPHRPSSSSEQKRNKSPHDFLCHSLCICLPWSFNS